VARPLNAQRVAASPLPPPRAGAARLFDLVKARNEDIRLAFYWALRNTLVAKDLDQASQIAYGGDRRFSRVVTLEVRCPLAAGAGGCGRGRVCEAALAAVPGLPSSRLSPAGSSAL
jgi:chromosome segregation ATPase